MSITVRLDLAVSYAVGVEAKPAVEEQTSTAAPAPPSIPEPPPRMFPLAGQRQKFPLG